MRIDGIGRFPIAMAPRLAYFAIALLSSAPASASVIAQVPEASNLTLFGLGVAGVLLGRHLSMSRKDDD